MYWTTPKDFIPLNHHRLNVNSKRWYNFPIFYRRKQSLFLEMIEKLANGILKINLFIVFLSKFRFKILVPAFFEMISEIANENKWWLN